eukprot:CAMPEP_0115188514 /NCGR_PEP_ID=MMETSP0270-20121206/11048_1 /TAXON_ID=71861 /ORGANISM="Scrippsiella trochoidea, Strain CCMP3099" /LENGTH=339 /DNA_ID=CAMNT_0002601695 /DNA_START=82 /DNA_END=1101 /DNA_ORIENTATION=+
MVSETKAAKSRAVWARAGMLHCRSGSAAAQARNAVRTQQASQGGADLVLALGKHVRLDDFHGSKSLAERAVTSSKVGLQEQQHVERSSEQQGAKQDEPIAPQRLRLVPRLPLCDKDLDLQSVNILLSSAQSREKCLKVLQYFAKLAAYLLALMSTHLGFAHGADSWGRQAAVIAKGTSQARRLFKLFRWLKHFEDIGAARSEGNLRVRLLFFLSIACNLAADISEDICSMERLGFMAAGTLPVWAELNANRCQLILALVEIVLAIVRWVRSRRESLQNPRPATNRRLWMAGLELSKFIADLGKAFWDCEFSFASEIMFILCGLWAACVSTHKYALKALK